MCTGPRVLCWMPGATAAAGAVPPGGQGHEAGHSTGWQPCTWWLSEAMSGLHKICLSPALRPAGLEWASPGGTRARGALLAG